MARKRLTDAEKWRDPWFRALPWMAKIAWLYLCDSCDAAGVWVVDPAGFSFETGLSAEPADIIAALQGRVVAIDQGRKWLVVKFCAFQYPAGLSADCKPHRSVLELLERHKLVYPGKGMDTVWDTVCQTVQRTVQDKYKYKYQDSLSDSNARATPVGDELFTADAEAIERATVKPSQVPPQSVGDLMSLGAIVKSEDRDGWQALLSRAGFAAVSAAITAIRVRSGKPWLSSVVDQVDQYGPSGEVEGRDFAILDGQKIPIRKRTTA